MSTPGMTVLRSGGRRAVKVGGSAAVASSGLCFPCCGGCVPQLRSSDFIFIDDRYPFIDPSSTPGCTEFGFKVDPGEPPAPVGYTAWFYWKIFDNPFPIFEPSPRRCVAILDSANEIVQFAGTSVPGNVYCADAQGFPYPGEPRTRGTRLPPCPPCQFNSGGGETRLYWELSECVTLDILKERLDIP